MILAKHTDWNSIISTATALSKEPYDAIYCVLDYDVIVSKQKELPLFSLSLF